MKDFFGCVFSFSFESFGRRRHKKYANMSKAFTSSSVVRLFLAGDFMPGRGIDAVMPRPCPLEIREGFCASPNNAFQSARKLEDVQRSIVASL